jgi:hypothetical protein
MRPAALRAHRRQDHPEPIDQHGCRNLVQNRGRADDRRGRAGEHGPRGHHHRAADHGSRVCHPGPYNRLAVVAAPARPARGSVASSRHCGEHFLR